MDFGLTLQTDPPASRLIELFQQAERLGFSHAWTFDSHILWQEPYVIHSQILSATERMMVGPLVTNPASRDPTVTASVFATLNDMFGNRTVCAIGRGDSALRVLGASRRRWPRPSGRSTRSASSPRGARSGVQRRRGAHPVGPRRRGWRSGWPPTAPRPSSVVGRCADGFVLQVADPEILRWTLAHVREAAEEAGPRTRRHHRARVRAGLRGRRHRPRARPVPLVRRHGRQPRRRDRRALRRPQRGARRAHRLRRRAQGLRLRAPRPRREPGHAVRPRRDRRPLLRPGHRPRHVAKLGSCATPAWTSSRST